MILHIETSTQICSVALSNQGQPIALEESNSEQYIHGERLTLYIQKVLETAKITANQLEAISVTKGPGSYTGLRIGMATVKGLAMGLSLPVFGISSLESIISLARQKHGPSTFAAAFHARSSEVFLRIQSENTVWIDDQAVDLVKFQGKLEHSTVIVGSAGRQLYDYLGGPGCVVDEVIAPSALGHVDLTWTRWLAGKADALNELAPNYTKPCFIAEKKS